MSRTDRGRGLRLVAVSVSVALLAGGITLAVASNTHKSGSASAAPTRLQAAPAPNPAPKSSPAPAPTSAPTAAAPSLGSHDATVGSVSSAALSQPVRVRIPAIHVDASILGVAVGWDGALEIPEDAEHVAWDRQSPSPSEAGTSILAAHVDLNGELGVFHDLQLLRAGDVIEVSDVGGSTHSFKVATGRFVAKSDPALIAGLASASRTSRPLLTLLTCGGVFDASRHSYLDNYIVTATS